MGELKAESEDVQVHGSRQPDPDRAGLSQSQPCPSVEIPSTENVETAAMPAASKADTSGPNPASPVTPSDSSRTFAFNSPRRHSCDLPPSPGFLPLSRQRTQSPALSIFERSVQEDIIPPQSSPSIPSHIITENYIPPVLEASSAVITDGRASPESIEVITHSAHQPGAAADVHGSQFLSTSFPGDNPMNPLDSAKALSPYGAPEGSDIRRLSFISFADVLNAESAEAAEQIPNRDPSQTAALQGTSGVTALQNRSPSPLQSPTFSSALGTSPPTSASPSFIGMESTLHRGGSSAGSPPPTAPSAPLSKPSGDIDAESKQQMSKEASSGDTSI